MSGYFVREKITIFVILFSCRCKEQKSKKAQKFHRKFEKLFFRFVSIFLAEILTQVTVIMEQFVQGKVTEFVEYFWFQTLQRYKSALFV